ncbi:MAG: RNA polymerase sigma factor [Bacteroidota bacterium]
MTKTRTNHEWRQDLLSSGPLQEAAITDLRDLLLRAALYFFSRNPGDVQGLNREETVQRAEDCAQDALMAVMEHLSDFRGDSKFTTWAYKFAINKALVAARRERWKGVSLDDLTLSDESSSYEWLQEMSEDTTPEKSAMQSEIQSVIREIIQRDLTDKQRQVLVWMVFHEVPLDEVVRHLGTNRNAVYKMLHDARRKLKIGLEQHGFDIGETFTLFGSSR